MRPPRPRSLRRTSSALFDQLDPVAVRVAHEAEPRAAVADRVGRPLGLDADARQALERRVQVVDRERDVPVAGPDVVGLVLVPVPGELEPRPVAGQAHEDVDRLVADRNPPHLLESELLVEAHRPVDLDDPVARVDQLGHARGTLPAATIGPRGEVAQLVEHTTENRGVAGSIPALAISRLRSIAWLLATRHPSLSAPRTPGCRRQVAPVVGTPGTLPDRDSPGSTNASAKRGGRMYLTDAGEQLVDHPLYTELSSAERAKVLMKHHVFAVWDFFSLLKRLQREVSCVEVPWMPRGKADHARFITEIVLGEECDENVGGGYVSHFELYLAAMDEMGADRGPIDGFVERVVHGEDALAALDDDTIPPTVREFVTHTLTVAREGG